MKRRNSIASVLFVPKGWEVEYVNTCMQELFMSNTGLNNKPKRGWVEPPANHTLSIAAGC